MIWNVYNVVMHATKNGDIEASVDEIFDWLADQDKEFVRSGKLAEYMNDTFHRNRKSYLSLSTPWQHLEEWGQYGEQKFDSVWEMLMYGGFIGYPVMLGCSSGCQMNPFLIKVSGVRSLLVDTASICCANQADYPVYGPEAGKPIKDVLVLIDLSMSQRSRSINRNALLGEKFTSVTVSRDLNMYTGLSMRIALHANCLLYLVTNEEAAKQQDVILDLCRAFLGQAFMCPACYFSPVDYFACSDLASHHGEVHAWGVTVDNSCPKCGWFSSRLEDWHVWDGTVCKDFIKLELSNVMTHTKSNFSMLSESRVDIVLRILYSFHKMCAFSNYFDDYMMLAQKIAKGEDLDFSAKAGIDGLSQVAIALLLLACSNKLTKQEGAKVFDSNTVLIAIIQEACTCEAKKKFLMKHKGNKEAAKKDAIAFVTSLLRIDRSTAPRTAPVTEVEPPFANVSLDCDTSFDLDPDKAQEQIRWVCEIAKHWCKVWCFAKGFFEAVLSRPGHWSQIKQDMETSVSSYKDVVQTLKSIKLKGAAKVLKMDDLSDLQSFFLRAGVGAILSGTAGMTKFMPNSLHQMMDSNNGMNVLEEAARKMRMVIYLERMSDKMATWKQEGKSMTFFVAWNADICEYIDLVNAKPHVHGFDKPTFWGLWKAAKNSKDSEKTLQCLRTANGEFTYKYSSVGSS